MNPRKWLALLVAACMLVMSASALADAQWAEDNGLNKTETVEELYQAALAEGGVLNLYGCTGRDETVGKAFEAAYPGITVNFIKDGQRVEKRQLKLPERITNVIRCKNPRCITSVEQELPQVFTLTDREKRTYRCLYCETKAEI